MCVATAIVVGVGAVGAVVAADQQRRASNNAIKASKEAADQALAVQKAQYAQARADFEPYAARGREGIGRLSTLGKQAPPTFDPTNAATWQGSQWQNPALTEQRPGAPSALPGQGQAPPQLGLPQAPPSAVGVGAAPAAQPAQPAGDTVLMQAPDGSPPRPVPSHLVQQLIAKGATVIS